MSVPQAIKTIHMNNQSIKSSVSYMILAIGINDGYGLSNEACCDSC